jgi:hypothetical protein
MIEKHENSNFDWCILSGGDSGLKNRDMLTTSHFNMASRVFASSVLNANTL